MGNCLSAARSILAANDGVGVILVVLPPAGIPMLGTVFPPSGGKISDWHDHRVVRIDGRYYDCMTGPVGMDEAAYRALFLEGDILVFQRADDL